MKTSSNSIVDTEKLSKKYRTNISKIITLWKRGRNDLEISASCGIELAKLQQIRGEIEHAHQKARYDRAAKSFLKL